MAKAKEEESKAVVKAEETALVKGNAIPDYIQEGADGFENARQNDYLMPRIVLMQSLSPEAVEGRARPGDMFNSLTEEMIIPNGGSFKFVVLYQFPQWIQWRSREEGGGLVAQSIDPRSELANIAARGMTRLEGGKEVPIVTEYLNFIVLPYPVVDAVEQILLACAKTSYKAGKKLLGLARMRNTPIYAGVYVLTAKYEDKGPKKKYFRFEVENGEERFVDKDTYEYLQGVHAQLKESFAKSLIQFDLRNEQENSVPEQDF